MTKLLTATAALALLPSAVWAQEAPVPNRSETDEIVLPGHTIRCPDGTRQMANDPYIEGYKYGIFDPDCATVVTATRAEQPASQSGQSVSVISAATLETRQTTVLSDLLATTPGVTVARTGGIGAQTSLFIRGADSSHTLVVVDGVRINDPSSPGGSYDFGNLLAGDIARVEVLRGADSVPWGSAAIGGVVNITTLAPTRRLSGGASAEGGSYGTSNLNGHLADTFGPVALSLGGGWYHTGGTSAFAASEGGKEADGFDQHYLNGRATLKLADNVLLDFRGRYARGNLKIDGYNTPSGNFGDDAEYSITQEASGYAGINADFLDGRFKNRFGYTVMAIHRDTYDYADTSAPFFTPGLQSGYIGNTERLEYEGDFKVVKQARLVFGAEHERSSFTTLNAVYTSPGNFRTGINSLYGQLILTPISILTLTGGVRYDHHSAYGDHTTFSANAALKATPTTTVRASFAQGFKAPTLYELYGDGGIFTNPNPNLKPETSNAYDVGVEQTAINGAVRARVTYFNRVSKNLIDYVFGGPPFYTGSYANLNRTRAEGEEYELTLNPISALSVSTNYTHLKSIDESTGLALSRRPDDVISFNADWNAKIAKFGGTIQSVSDSFNDTGNTTRLQGYVLVGLRASVPITKRLELYGRIDNLFDAQYQVVQHYGTLGRAGYAGVRFKI